MSCPSSLLRPEPSHIPPALYNFSYNSLFPKPFCPQCGYGYNPENECVSYDKYQDILRNAALYTSGTCPYGHIQLPGTKGCTSLLTGAFRAPEESVVANGQLVQISPKKIKSCCGVSCHDK
jgi:hypothetical protein